MIRLKTGALLIDNPGIREIAFWETDDSQSAFPEINRLAQMCRFADCTHMGEPGCAVEEAVEAGDLDQARLESYFRQRKELDFLKDREELGSSRLEKKKGKWIAQEVRKCEKWGR